MKEWLISGGINFAFGFVIGWLVFKRPDLATAAINWIKSKIPGLH